MFSKSFFAAAAIAAALAPVVAAAQVADPRPANAPHQKPAFVGQTDAPEQTLGVAFDVVTVADTLRNPWGMAFLPTARCSSPSGLATCGW